MFYKKEHAHYVLSFVSGDYLVVRWDLRISSCTKFCINCWTVWELFKRVTFLLCLERVSSQMVHKSGKWEIIIWWKTSNLEKTTRIVRKSCLWKMAYKQDRYYIYSKNVIFTYIYSHFRGLKCLKIYCVFYIYTFHVWWWLHGSVCLP